MQIYGFNKTTLLDYPKHLAATIFLGGCNMRCPFCHNACLVTKTSSQPTISDEEVLSTLSKRRNILEGICITGGEPTLYSDLPVFIKEIKKLGFKVKLDTNGTNPDMLKALAEAQLLDYVAMDIKNSREKYALTSGLSTFSLQPIQDSISYLLADSVDYEFRTTIVKEYHKEEDIRSIGQWLQGAKVYYLQSYEDSGDILTPGLTAHTKETLLNYSAILAPYVKSVSLRGVN